jgi:hypothetical protein
LLLALARDNHCRLLFHSAVTMDYTGLAAGTLTALAPVSAHPGCLRLSLPLVCHSCCESATCIVALSLLLMSLSLQLLVLHCWPLGPRSPHAIATKGLISIGLQRLPCAGPGQWHGMELFLCHWRSGLFVLLPLSVWLSCVAASFVPLLVCAWLSCRCCFCFSGCIPVLCCHSAAPICFTGCLRIGQHSCSRCSVLCGAFWSTPLSTWFFSFTLVVRGISLSWFFSFILVVRGISLSPLLGLYQLPGL